MDELRRPLFLVALTLLTLAVLVEIGSAGLVGVASQAAASALDAPTPGYGVPSLALLDSLLLFTIALLGLALVVPERVHGRLQGVVSLIVSFVVLLASIVTILKALVLLILMVAMVLAPIFGTLAYLALYGDFDRGGARIALTMIMTLKLGFAAFLVLAHQRFLQYRTLLLLIVTSVVAPLIVALLHGFVPGILASITDALAAIVNGILALIWSVVLLLLSIVAVLRVLRADRAS